MGKLETLVEVKRQKLETLIDEEALLLAKYLRDERKSWVPRIAVL